MNPALPNPDPAREPVVAVGDDLELVRRVQAGDSSAFDLLIEKYKERLYSLMYNMLSNRDDAADLSQEVFMKAFRSMNSFRNQADFYTWLYRIGVNTALNFIKRRREVHLSLNEMGPEVEQDEGYKHLTSSDNASEALDRGELQEKLNEALQKLSKEHRAVVVLHDIEGLRHHEVARILKCSEATARSRLFYAHQQLQALLANYL